jgi:hypothetical protein
MSDEQTQPGQGKTEKGKSQGHESVRPTPPGSPDGGNEGGTARPDPADRAVKLSEDEGE